MRYMILVRATGRSAAAEPALRTALAGYHEALARAGVLLDAAALRPAGEGWRLRGEGGRLRVVEDGGDGDGRVAGYTLIDVPSREAALEWSRRFAPPGAGDGCEIEVRRLVEPEEALAPKETPKESAAPALGAGRP